MSFSSDVASKVSALDRAILDLDSAISDAVSSESPDYREVAQMLFTMYKAKASIGMMYDIVAALLDKEMADIPEVDLGEGIRIEKKVASDRRAWKHNEIATEIARRLIMTNIDMETGESQKSTEELITEVLRFVQPSYWRVKELVTIGVNADNYCEVLEPKTSIIVRKPKVK